MSEFLIFCGIFVIILTVRLWAVWAVREKRKRIKAAWGKPMAHVRNWDQIQIYSQLLQEKTTNPTAVDDSTWHDLDLDAVFTDLDRTASSIGRQYLYALLHQPLTDVDRLKQRQRIMEYFAQHRQQWVNFHVALEPFVSIKDMSIPYLFLASLPEFPFSKWFTLLPLVIVPGSLIATFLISPYWIILTAGMVVVNWIIDILFKSEFGDYIFPVFSLRKLFVVHQRLRETLPTQHPLFRAYFVESLHSMEQVQSLRRLLRWLPTPQSNPDTLQGYLHSVLNQVFAYKILLYSFVMRRIQASQSHIHTIYRTIGELDALQAAASYKSALHPVCTPTFTVKNQEIHYQQLSHPLLSDPIGNDFRLHGESALITGSNMSGKSTFLKALGVNHVLAQTFYFCRATHAKIPFVHVISSMRREDDMVHGKSFSYTEVERVKTLLDHANTQYPQLILLDEIFRGTNTVERIAASREVLRYLDQPNTLVCAATHDIELADLLAGEYVFFHFREEVHDDQISFDYIVRPGISSTRNAIAILEVMEYPASLVQQARQLSQKLLTEPLFVRHPISSDKNSL